MDSNGVDIQGIEQLLATAQYAKVVEMCEAIQLSDDLPRKFWFCKAKALDGLGETQRAIECYRSEIASLKRVPPVLLGHVGVLLSEVGQYGRAVDCLRESCRIEPTAPGLVFLAFALSKNGQDKEAREILRRALDEEPTYDEAWHNLGGDLLDESPVEAEAAFRRALELDPDRADSYGGLGKACLAQDRFEEGIQAAQEGLRRNALSGLCHLIVGQGMEALGNLEGAEVEFIKAYRCDDYDKVSALLALARLFESRWQLDAAVAWYDRGLRAWPDDARIEDALAAVVERQGGSAPEILELYARHPRIQRPANPQ
jgi:tetratricopeptide (TPR) repeat protein